MPFPMRISEHGLELTDRHLQLAAEARQSLAQVRRENADQDRQERNEARRFHAWARTHLTSLASYAKLDEMERDWPWLLEPEEPSRRVVCMGLEEA